MKQEIFRPKFFSLLKQGMSPEQLGRDVLSGAVVAVIALPLSIAFAIASGVGPEKGLITAVIAGLIVAILGGSRVQIAGPTGAFIVIVYGILQNYGPGGLAASTFLAGILMILFGLFRMGNLLRFFPQPLIIGFTSGIALVIFSTQIRDALGLDIPSVPAEFHEKWWAYFQQIHSLNPWALLLTALTILIMILSRSRNTRIPGALWAILLLSSAVQLFNLPVTTIESFFGRISGAIQIQMPPFRFSDLPLYIAPALTIALLGSIESLLSAVVSDGMISGNHRSNTELIAQGLANLFMPFFGGIPATGAIARTAANVKNGGRSPVAGITHSLTLLAIMLFFGHWAKLIPMSVLAGILIVVSYNMSEWRSFISVFRSGRFDMIVLLSTFLLTVFVDLSLAIQVGVVLSALLFMKRMADLGAAESLQTVDSDLLDDYSSLPEGVHVYEISGPLFFGSAKRYTEVLKETGFKGRVLIIRMRHVPFIDSTGIDNLRAVIRILRNAGVCVALSGVNPEVLSDLRRSGILDLLPPERIFSHFEAALVFARHRITELS